MNVLLKRFELFEARALTRVSSKIALTQARALGAYGEELLAHINEQRRLCQWKRLGPEAVAFRRLVFQLVNRLNPTLQGGNLCPHLSECRVVGTDLLTDDGNPILHIHSQHVRVLLELVDGHLARIGLGLQFLESVLEPQRGALGSPKLQRQTLGEVGFGHFVGEKRGTVRCPRPLHGCLPSASPSRGSP